jgi:hypothetical protein
MPLTSAGKGILKQMIAKHGHKSGTRIFYSSINKGVPGSGKWHEKQMDKMSKYSEALKA